jgi:tetratricopeptide (TPR) repeat protein
MSMRLQNRLLALRVMAAGLSIAGALFAVSPAAADDVEACTNSSKSDVAIAACTRAIASGQYMTQNLATLYTSRGLAYEVTGQHDHAIQDFEQAMRLDPKFARGDRTDPVVVGDGLFVFCCRALVFDARIKATWAIRDGGGDLERCATACFEKLNSSHF